MSIRMRSKTSSTAQRRDRDLRLRPVPRPAQPGQPHRVYGDVKQYLAGKVVPVPIVGPGPCDPNGQSTAASRAGRSFYVISAPGGSQKNITGYFLPDGFHTSLMTVGQCTTRTAAAGQCDGVIPANTPFDNMVRPLDELDACSVRMTGRIGDSMGFFGAQGSRDGRRGFLRYARHGQQLGGASPLGIEVVRTPSRRQRRHREVGSEGSPRQSSDPRNTNRIRGGVASGKPASHGKARDHQGAIT